MSTTLLVSVFVSLPVPPDADESKSLTDMLASHSPLAADVLRARKLAKSGELSVMPPITGMVLGSFKNMQSPNVRLPPLSILFKAPCLLELTLT